MLVHKIYGRSMLHIGELKNSYEFCLHILKDGEPDSSVSIVSGCGLDDRTIEVRCPAEVKGFLL
jgi:hypothetical protein